MVRGTERAKFLDVLHRAFFFTCTCTFTFTLMKLVLLLKSDAVAHALANAILEKNKLHKCNGKFKFFLQMLFAIVLE